MIIDIIAFVLIILGVFKGIRNGFVVGVFSFFAFMIGLAAAIKLSASVAAYLGSSTNISQRWLPVLAFAIVFLIVVFLVRLGAKLIEGALKVAMLGWLNKFAGMAMYILLYLIILSVLLFYALQLNMVKKEAADVSVTYPFIRALGPKAINAMGVILPFFKDMFADLEFFFERFSEKIK